MDISCIAANYSRDWRPNNLNCLGLGEFMPFKGRLHLEALSCSVCVSNIELHISSSGQEVNIVRVLF